MKILTDYCWECSAVTKHKVLCHKEGLGWRAFMAVATLGFTAIDQHEYECQCFRCGNIKTIKG